MAKTQPGQLQITDSAAEAEEENTRVRFGRDTRALHLPACTCRRHPRASANRRQDLARLRCSAARRRAVFKGTRTSV